MTGTGFLLAAPALKLLGARRSRMAALLAAVGLTAVIAGLAAATVFVKARSQHRPGSRGVRFWDPPTGSRISTSTPPRPASLARRQ